MSDTEAERSPLFPSRPPDATSTYKEPSNRALIIVLGSVWIGVVLTALDSTIVATLSAPISNSFSSFKTIAWLGTSFLVATAATQPISGRFTDVFGRRRGLLVCNTAFGVGTLLCGLAQHEWAFILGRTVAGAGGGAIVAISTFIGSDLVPLRKRGVVQGINNIAMGVGTGLGGFLGGWLNQIWGWRWAFIVQVPFVLLGMVLVALFVNIPVKRSETAAWRRIDYAGSITLTSSLVLFLVSLNTGGNLLPWSNPLIIAAMPLSALLLGAFILIERRASAEPIIPLGLMLNVTVASACITYLFTYCASIGLMYYVPIYLQLLGLSPTHVGLRFIPQSCGTALGALTAGIIIRAKGKYVHLNLLAHGLLGVSSTMLMFLGWRTPPSYVFVALAVHGLGFGGMLVTTLIALISSVSHVDQAVITSASFAFRSAGSSLGLTFCSAVFQNILKKQLASRLAGYQDVNDLMERIRMSFDQIFKLDPSIIPVVEESYMKALQKVFILIATFSYAGAAAALLQRQNLLHSNLSRD